MSQTVSVVIPAYNQSQYLAAAIRSALAQTYEDIEVLVVDDGSTDDTRRVATGFDDSRVRYIYQNNAGLAAARNTGIRHARGSLLTFLDSDDLFLPEKLTLLRETLDANPRLGMVAGQAILIDELGEPLGEVFERGFPSEISDLLLGNPLHVGSVLLRREWQARIGLFDETLRSYEDWDMWLRLARAGCGMGWVAQPVSLYRFHRAQMTRIGKQMTTATFAVLEKTFADPTLPDSWRARRDEAYGRAHLRAAAQAYTGRDFAQARESMREAIRLVPALCADQAEPLARSAAAWANHAKTAEPMAFLEGFYANLPDELEILRRRRRRDLAREAIHLAFEASKRDGPAATLTRIRQALSYGPHLIFNRGVLALSVRTVARRLGLVREPGREPATSWPGQHKRAAVGGNS
jgi:hypothetical protein